MFLNIDIVAPTIPMISFHKVLNGAGERAGKRGKCRVEAYALLMS